MAGTGVTVNTDQVGEIASKLESLNKKLTAELNRGKQTINNLSNIWTGEAAQATLDTFNEFATKYFQNYEDVITQYVQFLRVNVQQGYFDTETQNISIANSFK